MRYALLVWPLLVWMAPASYAQPQRSLPEVVIEPGATIHFLSPEPVKYVDIGSQQLVGDIPLKNLVRLKLKDSVTRFKEATITVAGETFLAQYRILTNGATTSKLIDIEPSAMRPLEVSGVGHTQNQLRQMALDLIATKPTRNVESETNFGIKLRLHGVYTVGDHIFLDISCQNTTSLPYTVDGLRFHIGDQKLTKATNVQSLDIVPVLTLFNISGFVKTYRNVFVLKKLAIPGDKILRFEMSEKQVSGRVLSLDISYKDILKADTLPLD